MMNRWKALVVGCSASHVPTFYFRMAEEFDSSLHWTVEQRWGVTNQPNKFEVFNQHLEYANNFEYILFCDDDVLLPPGFLDAYLTFVRRFDFALAQPARTVQSSGSHLITVQRPGVARRTCFIEGGPVFSVRWDLYKSLLPFDVSVSGMCAGREFVWSAIVNSRNMKQGIIDATPVAHTLRGEGQSYDRKVTGEAMQTYLARHPEAFAPAQAMVVLEQWP